MHYSASCSGCLNAPGTGIGIGLCGFGAGVTGISPLVAFAAASAAHFA